MRRRTLALIAACLGGIVAAVPALAQTPPPAPQEVCDLLATVASTAGTVADTVETQAGQQLPVDLAGTVDEIAAEAGCGSDGPPSPAGPGLPPEACALLGTVRGAAATIQGAAEVQAGQALPVSLPGTLDQIARQAGCDSAAPPPGGGPAPAVPPEACDLLATLASTGATIQATVEAQAGQALPVSLAGTLEQIATQAGCAAAVPAPDRAPGDDGDKASPPPSEGAERSRSAPAEVLGTTATNDSTLPSTGGVGAFEVLGGASLGLAGLLEALRRRVAGTGR